MSKFREKIILNILFPLADSILGMCAMKWYRQITTMNKWSKDEVVSWQNIELQKFIHHAYNNTLYYKRVFDELRLKPTDIKTIDDLRKLPIINKEIANKYYDELVPKNISSIKYRIARTGGTTGEPMQYLCDENTWGYVTAAKIIAWKRFGYRYGDKFIALGSVSLFSKKPSILRRIYDKMRNELALNSVNMTDDICKRYVKIIQDQNIQYIYGYAASIYILTKYVKKHNIDLACIKVVFTTSENLTDHYRQFIQDTYKCKVMDCYGAKDAGITAYESDYKRYNVGYNIHAEIINPINDKNTGTLLTTNFANYSFPLIRYQFGDEVTLSNGDDNDYNGQIINQIIGRTSDVMRLSNGHNLTSTGFSMIMKEFDVVAFEIEKKDDLHIELRVQVIPDLYTEEQEDTIRKTIIKYIGSDCRFDIKHVDRFDQLANGKRRYFMN